MSHDTSYDYPGSEDSLGRRRRRGLINRNKEAPSPHEREQRIAVPELCHHVPVVETGRERILE